jgi:two-component system osmolarity sensor histidine kinase EnvZ
MLAGVSHDLRSILTRLRLGIALDASEERSTALIRHVDEMNRLIGQFLDYAKPLQESDATTMDLNEVVGTVVAEFEAEGVSVNYTVDALPLARLQPLAVRRLLANLMDNALRHAGGEVEVRTSCANGFVHVQVLDRGPGVSPAELGQLTQPFFRTPAARARVSGSGLGLAIAHRIVEAHGGFLRMALRAGGGLRVDVGFPVVAP